MVITLLFTDIPEKLKYPAKYRKKLIQEHTKIINYAVDNYTDSKVFKRNVINALNLVATKIVTGEALPDIDYTLTRPFADIGRMSPSEYKAALNDIYIDIENIEWNLTPTIEKSDNNTPKKETTSKAKSKPVSKDKPAPQEDTPKEWLFLKAPQYPRLDTTRLVLNDVINTERFYMYPSLPIIPEKQNEISCTTDVTKMTEKELLRLYPNRLIRTRAEVLYEPYGDIPMDKDLGLLLPIGDFTPAQFRENIIKFPHFFRLSRLLNDKEVSFYKHIEIDGQLYETTQIWDSLPDTKCMPMTAEFVKEYVVRRYLLEEEYGGITHKFPLRGTLDPYITLFAPPEFYKEDPVELARTCVRSRVSFYQSRNPFLERYSYVKAGKLRAYEGWNNDCPFKPYCVANECSTVCANHGEYSYLMERNGLKGNLNVYSYSPKALQNASEWLTAAQGCYKVVTPPDTTEAASCLTYVAVCQQYKGNTYHCSVYHLNFAEYINKLQQSWTNGPDDDLEYIQIFLEKAKVVIVSNLDFMQFKDFPAQILLNLAHNRKLHQQSTIIVSPKLTSLIGSGPFFSKMKEVFGKEVIDV